MDLAIVIVSLHVATGGALGALTGPRLAALALGPPLHLACDRVPHEDIADRRFEIRSGLFGLALLALCRGPLDPATLGAASAAAPDLEHIFPRLRPHGRKLFHGGRGWHRAGGLRVDVQLVLAGAIIGVLLKPPRMVRTWQTQVARRPLDLDRWQATSCVARASAEGSTDVRVQYQ